MIIDGKTMQTMEEDELLSEESEEENSELSDNEVSLLSKSTLANVS